MLDDEGDLTGCVELGLKWHATGAECLYKLLVLADPKAEVAQCAGCGFGIWEVEHG